MCVPVLAARPASGASASGELTAARFLPLLDTPFEALALSASRAAPLTLWLRSVESLMECTADMDASRDAHSFVLEFAVDGATATQDTYALVHAKLGAFAALLVPSRNAKKLVGIFNRQA